MWSKLLNINSLIIFFIISFSCKKEKYIAMKTGYYDVIETKTFPDGSMEMDNFSALGSYSVKSETNRYYFTRNKTEGVSSYSFDIDTKTATDTQNPTNSKITYKITELEVSPTELIVKRTEISDSLVSNIHFKYIE